MLLTKLLNINSTGVFLCKGTLTSNICVSIWISQFSKISVSDPDSLNPDLDPEDLLSSDSDSGYCWIWIQTKVLNNIFYPKPSYIFSPTKDIQALGNTPNQKSTLQTWNFLHFFLFLGQFWPAFVQIQIRISWSIWSGSEAQTLAFLL